MSLTRSIAARRLPPLPGLPACDDSGLGTVEAVAEIQKLTQEVRGL
jgi:hypothetical protein